MSLLVFNRVQSHGGTVNKLKFVVPHKQELPTALCNYIFLATYVCVRTWILIRSITKNIQNHIIMRTVTFTTLLIDHVVICRICCLIPIRCKLTSVSKIENNTIHIWKISTFCKCQSFFDLIQMLVVLFKCELELFILLCSTIFVTFIALQWKEASL